MGGGRVLGASKDTAHILVFPFDRIGFEPNFHMPIYGNILYLKHGEGFLISYPDINSTGGILQKGNTAFMSSFTFLYEQLGVKL